MFRSSFWRRLATIVTCVLLIIASLALLTHPKTAFAQQETISINPTQGPPGTKVTVTGTGWIDQGSRGYDVPIQISASSYPLTQVADPFPDANGNFTVSFAVPADVPPGQLEILAIIGNGGSADAWFTVTTNAPTLTVQKVWTTDGNNNTKTSFAPGDTIRYEAQVTNSGTNTVTATFTFLATGPLQIFSWSGPGPAAPGTVGFYSPSTIPANTPAGTYTLTVTVTYNGQSSTKASQFTVNIPPSPSPSPTPTPTSTPTLTPSPSSTPAPSPSSTPTPAATKADLAVTAIAPWKSTVLGGDFLYEITVVNNGPADATGVTLTDNLPFQLWPIIGTILSSQGNCPLPPASQFPITVTCHLGNLSVGKSVTVFFTIGINTGQPVQPGIVINGVKVVGDQPDPYQKNNVSAVKTEITQPSELTAVELNASLGLARKCGEAFIDLPFLEEVNNLIDKLEGHQMTPQEVWDSLTKDTLDLFGLKNKSVGLLSKLFNVPACISYSREIFSIGP